MDRVFLQHSLYIVKDAVRTGDLEFSQRGIANCTQAAAKAAELQFDGAALLFAMREVGDDPARRFVVRQVFGYMRQSPTRM